VSELVLDQPISTITVGDLKELMREVVREEQSYYIDEEGYLVFLSEDDYADYLDKQEGKLPSEVRAYFIDEQGYKAFYSDWVPTPEYAKELEEARKEPTVDADEVWEDLRKLGVDI
jgi:hypothetical protein